MENYLAFQIAAALVKDGAYKGEFDALTAALAPVYLGKKYRFGGAATPNLSPGSINVPTLYATARVGSYPGFSNQSVDVGQVCLFVSDDGAEWTKYIIIASGSGEPDYPQEPFTIEAKEAAVVKFYRSRFGESYGDFKVEASTDGGQTWTEITATSEGAEVASLAPGEKVLLRGTNERYGYYDEDESEGVNLANFNADGQCYVYGNIMSLMGVDDFSEMLEVKDGGFAYFFSDYDGNLPGEWVLSKEGSPLLLPATTLAQFCYKDMFYQCTGLTEAPELPATTLAPSCYAAMFYECTGLTEAPTLPAITLAEYCYAGMFSGCTGLTEAPALPATTLAGSCYKAMFNGCTGLTEAPTLPAITLAEYCYDNMFAGCTNLAYIKAIFTTTPGSGYTSYWVRNVRATGTFVKSAAATWNVTGNNGVPSGWTIQTE